MWHQPCSSWMSVCTYSLEDYGPESQIRECAWHMIYFCTLEDSCRGELFLLPPKILLSSSTCWADLRKTYRSSILFLPSCVLVLHVCFCSMIIRILHSSEPMHSYPHPSLSFSFPSSILHYLSSSSLPFPVAFLPLSLPPHVHTYVHISCCFDQYCMIVCNIVVVDVGCSCGIFWPCYISAYKYVVYG